jgi:hypothetical protein
VPIPFEFLTAQNGDAIVAVSERRRWLGRARLQVLLPLGVAQDLAMALRYVAESHSSISARIPLLILVMASERGETFVARSREVDARVGLLAAAFMRVSGSHPGMRRNGPTR